MAVLSGRGGTVGRPKRCVVAVLAVTITAAALIVGAQDPGSFEARAEFLLRRTDAGLLPTSMMVAMLEDPFPETRIFAIRAVASSADPSQRLLLWQYLGDRDFRVRYEVMIAAGRLGADGRELAFRGLGDGVPKVRQAAAWAASHGGPDGLPPLMDRMVREPDLGVRATALANLWRFDDAGWEAFASAAAADSEAGIRRAAAYSLARSTRPAARPALRRLATDAVAVIRASAMTGLGRAPLTREDVAILSRAVGDEDPRVRAAACGALAAQPAPAVSESAAASIVEMWTPIEPHVAVMAIRAAGARSEIGSPGDLLELARTEEPWLASEAFAAAVRRGADGAGKLGREWLSGGELWRRRAVAAVAPLLGRDVEAVVARDGDAAVRLAWLEPLDGPLVESRREVLEGLVAGDPDPAVRTAALNHLAEAGIGGGLDELFDLAERWRSDELPDARAAALTAALAATDDNEQRAAVIRRATRDADPTVGVLVINAARSMGLPATSHERELRHNRKYYLDLVEWMQDRHWLDVVTDRGTVRIRLESLEAPLTSREIYDLAAAGFYDDLTFHRVVPNFVVQGGDPRGDGWGGAGILLPDEPAFRPFDAGRVGIATSGPNTGGGQLFITLAPADHLVGHYTNVGEVVHGREILSRIRVGDRIRRVEVASGDEPPPPPPVVLGEIDWPQLETIDGWFEEYQAARPDQQVIAQLGAAVESYEIVTVLGSWCHDSQREVPRLVRVLDELDAPVFDHRMIGVDRTRRIDDAELAVDAGVERTVDRVATIVVFDGDGRELGRVVETAEKPIEELLLEFIAPAEGW